MLTVNEYKALGFDCGTLSDEKAAALIKRAECVISALCGGKLPDASNREKTALIKQAAAFKAQELISNSDEEITRVQLGDLSYNCRSKSSSEGLKDDTDVIIKKLLTAAGYLGGGIPEVIE